MDPHEETVLERDVEMQAVGDWEKDAVAQSLCEVEALPLADALIEGLPVRLALLESETLIEPLREGVAHAECETVAVKPPDAEAVFEEVVHTVRVLESNEEAEPLGEQLWVLDAQKVPLSVPEGESDTVSDVEKHRETVLDAVVVEDADAAAVEETLALPVGVAEEVEEGVTVAVRTDAVAMEVTDGEPQMVAVGDNDTEGERPNEGEEVCEMEGDAEYVAGPVSLRSTPARASSA